MNAPAPKPALVPRRKLSMNDVVSGKLAMPLRVLAYGAEGCGKSTFAAGSPSPIFLGAENGTGALDVRRLPEPQAWQDVLDSVEFLEKETHPFKTVVVDPLNWLEPLVFAHVAGPGGNIEKACGGYGKGYVAAVDVWRVFLSGLERLWRKGMNVVILAHPVVKKFKDPEGDGYDRYEIAMNDKATGLFKQWVDYVLFVRFEAFSKQTDGKRMLGFSTGARVIHTQWTAAYDAKRRLAIPDELPLSWDDFSEAVKEAGEKGERLRGEIDTALAKLDDAKVTAKVREQLTAMGDNEGRLTAILNRLSILINEKGQSNE